MTTSTRVLVTTAMLWAGIAGSSNAIAQAPPPGTTGVPGLPPRPAAAPPPAVKGTAVISGRILATDTGLPLRRARVTVHGTGQDIPSGPDAIRATITDADGAFALTGLSAGRYRLEASKPRYVDTAYGARPSGLEKPIEVAEGQKVESITVSLTPAGVIVGHVVDELGEPVMGAQIAPMQAFDSVKGTQIMPVAMSDTTDDRGAYRLHGLPPGTYYVSARSDDDAMSYRRATAGSTPGFAPTFFPGTAVAAEAQAIEVVAGVEAVADIALVPTRLSSVSGVVVNAAGALATGGFISAQPGTGTMRLAGSHIGAEIEPDGSFALSGLAPGEYAVQARPAFEPRGPFPSGAETPMNRRSVATHIVVTGEPISGLRLVLPDPIRIPVTATFENATGRPPEQVSVSAYSERTGSGESTVRGADGRLTLELSPGTWRFNAHASRPWMVKRLTYRGDDVEELDEVEVADGPGGRLEVVFTRSATVTGSVKNANGTPVADYVVYVLTADEGRTYPSGRWMVTTVRPDQAGRFKTEHLRPGAYIALATEEPDPDNPGHGDFQERLRRLGTPFRLRESETTTLDLTLVSLP